MIAARIPKLELKATVREPAGSWRSRRIITMIATSCFILISTVAIFGYFFAATPNKFPSGKHSDSSNHLASPLNGIGSMQSRNPGQRYMKGTEYTPDLIDLKDHTVKTGWILPKFVNDRKKFSKQGYQGELIDNVNELNIYRLKYYRRSNDDYLIILIRPHDYKFFMNGEFGTDITEEFYCLDLNDNPEKIDVFLLIYLNELRLGIEGEIYVSIR